LPGVKELFARHAQKLTKRKRGDIYKYITPDYYGLRDDEDGVLLELEGEMATENQKKLRLCVEEYKEMKKNATTENDHDNEESSIDVDVGNGIPAHLAVPSQQVVASVLLQKKKAALLDRFA
jgi:pre-mRNA-splicing factor ISY1